MKGIISLTTLLSTLFLVGCGDKAPEKELETPRVRVTSLAGSKVDDNLYFPAVANAADRSHLSFRVAGEVSSIMVKEGDKVTKGDVIATLDPTDYELDVDNASARFSVVDSQYRRSRPLVDKGLLAKSQFDEIAAQRQIALAELQLAKLRLSFTALKAPVDGIISRVNIDQFENVQVGQHIVNIHSLERVEVLIQLPDRLYVNQPPTEERLTAIKALVRVPSGNEYNATVKEFTTEPDPTTGTFTVTLSLPMPEEEYILDGMAVEVTSKDENVGLDLNLGINVPIEAIFNADGDELGRENKFVWVLNDDNTVSRKQVRAGKASKTSIQILDGLMLKDKVVIAGVSRLRDGMKVEVIQEMATQETGL
ncbi:TPA: efflux RND transporter periplasmic adaptor subunit [Vibrio alginolyticus]|uniref:efflux RND transporter periplasmic adaptor subunit n=1 Tax=Vibrio TaxID=662 RepID=UPI001D374CEC|nr:MULTISPECIES: efflux RND transporter periplasmic adaptor subunit [Vibrio]EGQ9233847.1 efflux RND transporter periplasmic adaptor subunit [Vibrio alginolyticus]EHI5141894.1 efflux RND transporter periplasmic adaptor subunit [Vibrio alginolyticus]EJR0950606.1 efflux RND transporter periplasmic adaptor subunit [Vibrio alginolyticus]EJR0953529.1 efflux RND transporter periplasmic adaptor subunit [Vibrio alginolyticus]ELB2828265.1 efflux RND transporter periplasmic adaptor subunit [Vibrio algino